MTRPKASYGPGNSVSLTLSGDPGAKVGLVAVDKGVYTLNNNHRLTQNKIWDTIEKLDTGCTVGGGADSLSVFYDAGLIIETNAAFGTQIRTDPSCPYKGRQRRAVMSEEPGKANLILLKPDKHGGAQTEHIRSAVYRDQVPNSHADTLISVKKDDLEDNEIMIKVVARPSVISWQITKENQFRNYQIRYFDKSMTVTASGKGEVSVIVERWYYALPEKKESDCENLDFSITFTKMDRPSHQDAEESFMLNIDVLYHKERDATILILDIGLLNGFIVDTDDLKMLAIERGCSIERFEMGRVLSERGSLIIHLDKVSHKVADKISFKVHRVMNVRDLQPAAISVCEFQNKTPCVKFYRPQRGGTLNTVCFEDSLCTCAEERCSVQKNDVSEKECMDNVRELSTDYVYKATVVDMNLTTQTDTYTMSIAQVLKAGKDEKVMKGTKVVFMGLPYCREALGLKVGQTYIIMGESRDTHLVRENDLLLYKYFLGEKTWIEHWPTVSDCLSRGSKVCQEIEKLRHQIVTFGYGV
uniref:NTR domain-containing protein n=1 Tax=Esox lucius TaxID=8010 RepID=A0AAY5KVJ9_ESOLU